MSNYEATKYNFDGANLTDIEGIPTATIIPWSDSSAPSGFLECNGAAVSRSTYAALFAVIGTTYGAGNGSTTFAVPDLQDNVAVSKSGTKNLASTGGANTVAATGNIAGSTANASLTTAQLASHSHSGSCNFTPCQEGTQARGVSNNTGSAGQGQAHSHNMSANFTGDALSVVQPYLTVLYIIKT
jgi:microcystin-dependent protein